MLNKTNQNDLISRLFLLIFISIIMKSYSSNSPDYFPLNVGNYWVYSIKDSLNNIIGKDSSVVESTFVYNGYNA